MVCRFCGNENSDSSVNCFICGKPLVANLVASLADINESSSSNGSYAINNLNDPYANRFASDTGGGPAIGPQSFSAQIMAGETTKKSSGVAGVAIVIILLVALLVAGWFLLFSPNAPFAYLLPSLTGGTSSDAAAIGAVLNL